MLLHVLKEKFDEKKMHKVGSAMKAFFKLQVDRSWTLTETMDHMDRAARLCKEAGLILPDEIMTHFFFEHSGSSFERQANILLRTGGEYTWKKVKAAVELLYPQTAVAPRRDRDYKGFGKGRMAHEVQGTWDDSYEHSMDLEDWLFYEDPIEKTAEWDNADYLPENLARELHEVYNTHRENRARLAKAVKARGFYVNKGKGKKGGGGSKGKGPPAKGAGKSSQAGGKSKSKGGKARGMSLEELKKVTTCADCGEMGHWKGDPQGAKKAHEVLHEEAEEEDPTVEQYDYSQYWYGWQDDNEAWTATRAEPRPQEPEQKSQKSKVYPNLNKEEAEEVIANSERHQAQARVPHAGACGTTAWT